MRLNSCNLIGNLGKDQDCRHTKEGNPVIGFNLAVSSGWGDRKTTAWCRISVFGKTAEYLQAHPGCKGDIAIIYGAEYRVDNVAPPNGSDEQVKEYHSFCVSGFGSECWILPKGTQARSEDEKFTPASDDDLPF